MTIIDQFHDAGYGVLRALMESHTGAYDLVKTAELSESGDELPDSAFAWEDERRYPIHTKEHAVLSALYTKVAAHVPQDVVEKIAEALNIYGVTGGSLSPVQVKEAAADDAFIFPEERLYHVKTASDLRVAESRLLEQVSNLTPTRRAEAFTRLYKRAEALGQPLAQRSYQYAGVVETDLREVKTALDARAEATQNESARLAYVKLASTLGTFPRRLSERGTQVKLAQYISDLDERAGVTRHYDRRLADPISTVFNTTRVLKVGEQMVDLGSTSFPLTSLASLPPAVYGDILGPDIVAEISDPTGNSCDVQKLMQILPTLPADMKEMLGNKLHGQIG